MKDVIIKHKVVLSITSIVLLTIAIIAIVSFNYLRTREKEVAKIDNLEENNIEKPDGEYIDIEDIVKENEEQPEEPEEQENENTTNNKDANVNTNNMKNKVPYYIKVNYGAQVVTIYGKDSEENYTVPVKAMVCSTGVATPTSGVYSIPARWEWLRLKGYVWGHYSTQITGNILFHSVPYLRKGY